MVPIDGGATIWARQTIDSEIFFSKPDKWFKIWFYIVSRVFFSDNGKFKKGQRLLKYEWISDATGATKNQIDMFMRWAKKERMLTTQKTTRGMIVSITNYSFYQDLDNYKTDTETDLETKQKRNRNDTILEECKNGKKEKKKELYGEFILLTDDEHKRLLTDFGEINLRAMFNKLDNYFGADSKRLKKYTSHNHVLRGWVAEGLGFNKVKSDFVPSDDPFVCKKCKKKRPDIENGLCGQCRQ